MASSNKNTFLRVHLILGYQLNINVVCLGFPFTILNYCGSNALISGLSMDFPPCFLVSN